MDVRRPSTGPIRAGFAYTTTAPQAELVCACQMHLRRGLAPAGSWMNWLHAVRERPARARLPDDDLADVGIIRPGILPTTPCR